MILRLDRVSKSYPHRGGTRVLFEDVSLEIGRGQIVGIFGPSAAGKTTLLRIAAGLERPDSGAVYFKDERLDEMPSGQQRRHRRRDVACVWAGEAFPAGMSVREHVELPLLIDGCPPHVARRVTHKLLLACEVEDCAELEPNDLSDGERLRVAIARALVIEPCLLLVDGAISGLSILEQRSVMDLLSRLACDAKVAVLVADTGASEILRADPILYLRDGKLIGPDAGREPGKLYRLPRTMPPPRSRSAADA